MRILLVLGMGLAMTVQAHASCVCRCVDGKMQPLCSSSIDVPPICPATVCMIPPAAIAPMPPVGLPPLGTSQCSERQVLNPSTGQYEWRRLCQ